MLNKYPIMTAKGPVICLDKRNAGVPISMVSGSALCIESPTGTKSAPTWTLIANNAGKAKTGLIIPAPIFVPIKIPIT